MIEPHDERAVMMCLRCGYLKQGTPRGRDPNAESPRDKDHLRRCDFSMTIRYICKYGISGGARKLWACGGH